LAEFSESGTNTGEETVNRRKTKAAKPLWSRLSPLGPNLPMTMAEQQRNPLRLRKADAERKEGTKE